MSQTASNDMRINVQDNLVTIVIGTAQATVPADQIDGIIKALHAAQMLVNAAPALTGAAAAPAPVVAPAPVAAATPVLAPAPAPEAPAAAPKRRGRPPKHVGPDGQPLSKRRSRKRVGDALEVWLHDNPGWHSEQELIELVRRERMSDADPHRALKIALGKQKDTLFETDGKGNWTLAGSQKKRSRAAGAQAKEAPSSAPAVATKGKKAAKGAKPTPRARKAEAAPAKTAKAATKKESAPRTKRASTSRKRQGSGRASKSADLEGSQAAEAAAPPKTESTSKPVRVKKGEKRDAVLQAGRKQEQSPAERLAASFYSSAPERERIRRNLFGDTAD